MDWLVWQIVDSAFPTGGFAHSLGLEAAWQSAEVPPAFGDEDGLDAFLRASVVQAGRGALPLVTAAHRDPGRIDELDTLCDAFLTSAVANRASRVQGRAFVATCARTWPTEPLVALDARARQWPAHHAPSFGAALRALDVSVETAQKMFLHLTVRTVLSAAVRLGVAGPYRAQRLQSACAAHLNEVLDRSARLDERDLAQTAPIIDLVQSLHDRLYSRLFQS